MLPLTAKFLYIILLWTVKSASPKYMNYKHSFCAGHEEQYGPRLIGEILHDYLEKSNEPLAVAYRTHHLENPQTFSPKADSSPLIWWESLQKNEKSVFQ